MQNVPLMTVGNVAVGPLLQRVLHIARTHKVRLDSNFVTMFVSIALLEGIGRQLQPDLRLVLLFLSFFLLSSLGSWE